MKTPAEIFMVVSTNSEGREYVESVWFSEETANSVVAEMNDDHYTFGVVQYDVLDAEEFTEK